jgi:hypothetical protein
MMESSGKKPMNDPTSLGGNRSRFLARDAYLPKVSSRRTPHRWCLLAIALAVQIGGGTIALAQSTPALDPKDPNALNRRAGELLKEDAFAEAEKLARSAWEMKQSFDIAGNLGLAELGLKHYRDAAEHLSYALRTLPTAPKEGLKQVLDLTIARAKAVVAEIRITVRQPRAEVRVDGVAVGVSPLPVAIFVDPGSRTFEAIQEGYDPARQQLEVKKGESREVALVLQKTVVPIAVALAPAMPVTPPPQPPPPGPLEAAPRSVIPALVTGAVALVGVGFGIGGFAASASKTSQADQMANGIRADGGACGSAPPPGFQAQCDAHSSLSSEHVTWRTVGIVGFAAGSVAAAATFILWPRPKARLQSSAGVEIAPVLRPDARGFVLTGKF